MRPSRVCNLNGTMRCALIVFSILAGAVVLYAQPPDLVSVPIRGTVPNGAYAIDKIEAIDVTSGNVSIRIPITSLPKGRAGSSVSLDLFYNSSIYATTAPTVDANGVTGWQLEQSYIASPDDTGGWHYGFNYQFVTDSSPNGGGSCPGAVYISYRYRMLLPDGSSHTLYLAGTDADGSYDTQGAYLYNICRVAGPEQNATFYTADGTYLRLVLTNGTDWTLYLPDGRVVTGANTNATSISDRNGNTTLICRDTDPQSGRYPRTLLVEELLAGTSCGDPNLTTSNRYISIVHNTDLNYDDITQPGYQGQVNEWQVNYKTVTLGPNHMYVSDSNNGTSDAGGLSWTVVASILLPTHQQYSFCYNNTNPCVDSTITSADGWAQLANITLPTGANSTYTYGTYGTLLIPGEIVSPGVTSKTLNWTDENTNALRSETTTYAYNFGYTDVTAPDGGVSRSYYSTALVNNQEGPLWRLVYEVQHWNALGAVVEQDETVWGQNIPYGTGSVPVYHYPGNPFVQTELKSLDSAETGVTITSVDRNGNPLTIQECDWVPFDSVSHNNAALTNCPGSSFTRNTQTSYVNPTPESSTVQSPSMTDDTNGYWNNRTNQLLRLPVQTSVGPAVTQYSYDDQDSSCSATSGSLTKGNLTQEKRLDSGNNGAYQTTIHGYDSWGNLTCTKNPRGYTTKYTYDSNNLYVQRQQQAVEDSTNTRTFTYEHDFYSGALKSQTDTDHTITTTFGYDRYARLTSTNEGGVRSKTINYNDATRTITEYSDRNQLGDNDPSNLTTCTQFPATCPLVQITSYDQLGRVRQTQDWAGNIVQNDRCYGTDSGTCTPTGTALYELTSNPTLNQGESTMGWTRTKLDILGRVIEVKHYQGAALPAPFTSSNANTNITGTATYSYNANTTTYTDEASNSWARTTDGLGRLTQVTENGIGATTQYGYDALDDLTSVIPATGTGRTFNYTSLKQLQSATNPESQTVRYTYDANGNLLTKTDGRGITTTYCYNTTTTSNASTVCYDGLDELLGKSYSDSGSSNPTPWVGYTYNKGWLTKVNAGNTSYNYTNWDGMGRVTQGYQATNGTNYPFTITYTPYMGIQSIQYPNSSPNSSRTITTAYDSGGRPAQLTGQVGTNPLYYYVGDGSQQGLTQFWPNGEISSMKLANGLTTTTQYNSRLQPTSIQVGNLLTLSYTYSATQNNGNVASQQIQRNNNTGASIGDWTATYGYDGVNRLTSASEVVTGANTASWSEGYGYSVTGNRWLTSDPSGLPTPSSEVPIGSGSAYNANNQMGGWYYDGAGNLTGIPVDNGTTVRTPCASTLAIGVAMFRVACYDAENRMTSVTDSNGSTSTYVYDGDGRRVQKTVPGTGTTTFVYDPMGNLAQEYGPATAIGGTEYLSTDMLGSTRLVTDNNGNTLRCYDYVPFGEEIGAGFGGRPVSNTCYGSAMYPASGPDILSEKFTGKERDAETGLDWFETRYLSSAQGRFTSPDPDTASGKVPDPQSWNMYSYARNTPLVYTDPTGMNYTVCDVNGANCTNLTDQQYNQYLASIQGTNVYVTPGGTINYQNDNGSVTKIGTASYYNEGAQNASAFLDFAITTLALNYVGELAGPAIGALRAGSGFMGLGLEGAAESANALAQARKAVPLKDPDTVRRVEQALEDIASGNRRYSRDGISFQNREGTLPNEPQGYYTEYTVQPPSGVTNRGTERLVVGQGGEVYYTPNHYGSFVRIQ